MRVSHDCCSMKIKGNRRGAESAEADAENKSFIFYPKSSPLIPTSASSAPRRLHFILTAIQRP
jgi:hypothetical protein